jgi:ribosomal protein S18 acetylase RimI-like enzyme
MRFDLGAVAVPRIALPEGVTVREWTADLAARFHAVYAAAFGERPGFPGWSAERWVSWTAEDEGFRPGASLLATAADGADVGFVTSADGWIVQVGVPPAQRGRRLGAALVCAALQRQRAAGATEVLLDVSVDNPAGELYRRLGFVPLGRRARYRAE